MSRCQHRADPTSCPACYAEDVGRASTRTTLAEDLATLEATNPEVAAASAEYDQRMHALHARIR